MCRGGKGVGLRLCLRWVWWWSLGRVMLRLGLLCPPLLRFRWLWRRDDRLACLVVCDERHSGVGGGCGRGRRLCLCIFSLGGARGRGSRLRSLGLRRGLCGRGPAYQSTVLVDMSECRSSLCAGLFALPGVRELLCRPSRYASLCQSRGRARMWV